MKLRQIHWGRALGGAALAEVMLIAAAFGWVAIYSYLINPGQPLSVYEQHATESGPWVSIVVGIPLFYAAARWIGRNRPTALVLCALVLMVDAVVLAVLAGSLSVAQAGLIAVSYVTKGIAAWFGGGPTRVEAVTPR